MVATIEIDSEVSESNACCSNSISVVELSDPREVGNSLFNTSNISLCDNIIIYFYNVFNFNLTYDFEMDKNKSKLFSKTTQTFPK